MGSVRINSPLKQASSGRSRNCSFWFWGFTQRHLETQKALCRTFFHICRNTSVTGAHFFCSDILISSHQHLWVKLPFKWVYILVAVGPENWPSALFSDDRHLPVFVMWTPRIINKTPETAQSCAMFVTTEKMSHLLAFPIHFVKTVCKTIKNLRAKKGQIPFFTLGTHTVWEGVSRW